ncbi:MAG: hypothetical protein U1F57_04615 [bacterium]
MAAAKPDAQPSAQTNQMATQQALVQDDNNLPTGQLSPKNHPVHEPINSGGEI